MDTDSATNAVKEEHLPVEESNDSLGLKITDVRSLAGDADGSCTTECVSGDWSAEVKQEPDDVCCAIFAGSITQYCSCTQFLLFQRTGAARCIDEIGEISLVKFDIESRLLHVNFKKKLSLVISKVG